jgi:hypothetical protein
MHLSAEINYPGADPTTVFSMITDRAFQERKCVATGSLAYEVQVQTYDDDTVSVTTHRTLPSDEVPEFMRRFVGGAVRVVEQGDWQPAEDTGARRGSIVVEMSGIPVRLTGELSLRPFGDGTVYEVDGDLKASVPLIGGKIEKAAESAIRSAIRVEERTGQEWLQGSGP